MHYGYEVLISGVAVGQSIGAFVRVGAFLSSFGALVQPDSVRGASASRPTSFVHRFTGGECKEQRQLLGGLSTEVFTFCGDCEAHSLAKFRSTTSASGLTICNFSFSQCSLSVHVSLPLSECPQPVPTVRVGLDVGSRTGWADVAHDGATRTGWRLACGGSDRGWPGEMTDGGDDVGGQCTTLPVDVGSAGTNLTLWLRVMSGTAFVHLHGAFVRELSGPDEAPGPLLDASADQR